MGYNGLSITGRCGPINWDKCGIIEKRLVPAGPLGKYHKGLYVGLDQWNGSDFFIPNSRSGVIVSLRAANILKEKKLTNIELRNLSDIETPDFTLRISKETPKI